jgi:hypothetical protein
MDSKLISQETIQSKIFFLRGKKVMIDRDLAILYEVPTKALNQAVKRNIHRFPEHFMFQLTSEEKDELVTKCDRFKPLKHSTSLPYAFTEHGVAMLSSVLNSEKAIMVNIQIINTFIRMRELLMNYEEIKQKIEDMEEKYDYQFKVVFEAIRQLLEPPEKLERKIGFQND